MDALRAMNRVDKLPSSRTFTVVFRGQDQWFANEVNIDNNTKGQMKMLPTRPFEPRNMLKSY